MEELLSIINGDNKTFIRQNTMLSTWGRVWFTYYTVDINSGLELKTMMTNNIPF